MQQKQRMISLLHINSGYIWRILKLKNTKKNRPLSSLLVSADRLSRAALNWEAVASDLRSSFCSDLYWVSSTACISWSLSIWTSRTWLDSANLREASATPSCSVKHVNHWAVIEFYISPQKKDIKAHFFTHLLQLLSKDLNFRVLLYRSFLQ